LMSVLTVKRIPAAFRLPSADAAYGTDIMLLYFQNNNSGLPCLVFQFSSHRVTQLYGRKLPRLLHDDLFPVFIERRQNKYLGPVFHTIIDHLTAELVSVMIVQILDLLPVCCIGIRIVPSSCRFPGSVDLIQDPSAPVRVFRSALQKKAAFHLITGICDAAHKRGVFIRKNYGAYPLTCLHAFFRTASVAYRLLTWHMEFSTVFAQDQGRRQYLSVFRKSIPSES